jgi:hypothetical protein
VALEDVDGRLSPPPPFHTPAIVARQPLGAAGIRKSVDLCHSAAPAKLMAKLPQ